MAILTRTTGRTCHERGVALVVVILALVVLGVLVSGIFMAAVLENRAGQNSRPMEQAFAAAEYGMTETIANWNTVEWNALANLATASVSGQSRPAGTGTYSGVVQRLDNQLFLVDIRGRSAAGSARQRIGAFVKLRNVDFKIEAALTTRGPTRVGGSARIDATDRLPPGTSGCPGLETELKPGIRTPNENQLSFPGCGGKSCITGDPEVQEDPSINDDTFDQFGDADWAALTALATKRLPGGNYQNLFPRLTVDGKCDTSHPRNWGDPQSPGAPCANYYPIIYVSGNLTVNTGVGQGLLLVEGDLMAQGKFEFWGIVIVKGALRRATGSGNRFNGGILASNVPPAFPSQLVLGNVDLNYSSCAVIRAQQAGSAGALLRSRGWVQLF